MNEDMEHHPVDPKTFYILSKDFLRGLDIDQHLPNDWTNHPPLFQGNNAKANMKMMPRKGIPEAIRCAVWLISAVRIANPHQPETAIEEYGTLAKVAILDYGWELILQQLFPDPSDESDAILPEFGLPTSYLECLVSKGVDDGTLQPLPPSGRKAMTRVLCAIQFHLDLQYCPLLPHMTSIFLSYMSESYTYHILREMMKESSRYFPLSEQQHCAWCKTFADMVHKMYPQTGAEMERNSALSIDGLDPIFKRFFSPILRRKHVYRVMDLYVTEGYKALFRIGIALIASFKKELKNMHINSASLWWAELRSITHSPNFDFDKDVMKKAYGFHGSRLRKRIRFPRRRTIDRRMIVNERWVEDHMEFEPCILPPKPLGFMEYANETQKEDDNDDDRTEEDESTLELARPASVRVALAQWVPHSLLSYKLDMIYSTNIHGRNLNSFYDNVHKTKRTIMLVEVFGNHNEENKLIGVYASQAWHRSNHIYGDGGCFLFSITPDANCYKWRPRSAGSIDDEKNESLMEQFMLSKDHFIAMGGNKNGSSGLKLNDDFTKGESTTALGFENEPLAGEAMKYFDVGLVEVYRFVRAFDGKGIDGEDDEIWNL